MLSKEEIEVLDFCVGIAIGEAGSGTQTDLAIEAIEKLKAAEHSAHPTSEAESQIDEDWSNDNDRIGDGLSRFTRG